MKSQTIDLESSSLLEQLKEDLEKSRLIALAEMGNLTPKELKGIINYAIEKWNEVEAFRKVFTNRDVIKYYKPIWNIIKKRYMQLESAMKTPKHIVGEVHPKNKNWVWTEYKPNKFDWRIKK